MKYKYSFQWLYVNTLEQNMNFRRCEVQYNTYKNKYEILLLGNNHFQENLGWLEKLKNFIHFYKLPDDIKKKRWYHVMWHTYLPLTVAIM